MITIAVSLDFFPQMLKTIVEKNLRHALACTGVVTIIDWAQIDYWQKFRTLREVRRFTSYLTGSRFAWPSGRDNVSIYTGTSVHTNDVASVADCSVSWPDEFALHFGRCHRSFS